MVQTTEENVTLYFYTIFLKLQLFHTKILIGQLFCNDHIKFLNENLLHMNSYHGKILNQFNLAFETQHSLPTFSF